MIEWKLNGLPDNLQPGRYATRVKSSSVVDGKVFIILEFAGDINPDDPSLVTITKED